MRIPLIYQTAAVAHQRLLNDSGSSWTPQTLVVENAAPTHVVMTSDKANTNLVASNFTISGFTVSSLSRDGTNKILTLTLNTPIYYGEVVSVSIKGKSYSVTNNVAISAEYTTVYNATTNKPTGNNIIYKNKWLKSILNLCGAKAIVLDNFANADAQASLLNWKSPGTCNPTKQDSPNFIINKGWQGVAGGGQIKLNFTPSVNGAGFLGQDDMTVIVGINENNINGNRGDFGCAVNTKDTWLRPQYNTAQFTTLCDTEINGGKVSAYTTSSKKYFTLSRNSGTQVEIYKDLVKKIQLSNSVGLTDSPLWACGDNLYNQAINTISFVLIFKYLTEDEVQGVIRACEEYLNHYGNKVRTFQTNVEFNLVLEGHSFVMWGDDQAVCAIPEGTVNARISFGCAIGGESIDALVTRSATIDAKLIVETATYKNILYLWIGVNDVVNTAGQGTTAYNALKSYVQARVIAGWKCLVFTMTPSTFNGRGVTFEAERVIFNNLMRADLVTLANVYILDTDTVPHLCNSADTTYFNVDALHLTWAGRLLANNLFVNEIEQLYG